MSIHGYNSITTKGQKLIVGAQLNWINDSGDPIVDPAELIRHIYLMDDKEFDTYLRGEPYLEREEIMEETYQKKLEFQQKHPTKTKGTRGSQ